MNETDTPIQVARKISIGSLNVVVNKSPCSSCAYLAILAQRGMPRVVVCNAERNMHDPTPRRFADELSFSKTDPASLNCKNHVQVDLTKHVPDKASSLFFMRDVSAPVPLKPAI